MSVQHFDDDTHEDDLIHPEQRAQAASKTTWVSVFVNLFLSIFQIVVGIFAKSQGLIADGIHTLSDLVADFIVLFANHHSKKEADEDHPLAITVSRQQPLYSRPAVIGSRYQHVDYGNEQNS